MEEEHIWSTTCNRNRSKTAAWGFVSDLHQQYPSANSSPEFLCFLLGIFYNGSALNDLPCGMAGGKTGVRSERAYLPRTRREDRARR